MSQVDRDACGLLADDGLVSVADVAGTAVLLGDPEAHDAERPKLAEQLARSALLQPLTVVRNDLRHQEVADGTAERLVAGVKHRPLEHWGSLAADEGRTTLLDERMPVRELLVAAAGRSPDGGNDDCFTSTHFIVSGSLRRRRPGAPGRPNAARVAACAATCRPRSSAAPRW